MSKRGYFNRLQRKGAIIHSKTKLSQLDKA